MNQSLLNQIALVTGGNAGIGKAIVRKFIEEGAKVAVFGTNDSKGKLVIEEMTGHYPQAHIKFYKVDVAKTQEVQEAINRVIAEIGAIDILVNNAGITADQLLLKMSEEEWDLVLNTNLKSCYNTCRCVVRSMMKARKGKIINISSIIGLIGNIGQVNYSASKAGMIGFTKALAKELASRQILVNCVAPGFIQTDMTDKLGESVKEKILQEIPLAKMGKPEDIANAVWFLASSFSNYLTGQVLTVDGGMAI